MDDTIIAQQIIGNQYQNIKKNIYHDTSFIFPTTNEKINLYKTFFQKRKKALSVIGSGDQILNLILSGCKNIDGFDISRFPKYFLELKKAGILSLTVEEFISFFFDITYQKDEMYDDMYWNMRDYLKEEDRNSWDGLLNFYDWSFINQSTLFSSQTVSLNNILENNDYLKKENYQKLKELILLSQTRYYIDDIQHLTVTTKETYDFINLSSIMYYMEHYKEFLKQLPLTQDGIALTYLYEVKEKLKTGYSNCEILPFKDCKEGVMIYKKIK